jgi:hypothetical protein
MRYEIRFMLFLIAMSVTWLVLSVVPAMAVVAPVSGSFAYDLYDVAVNKMLQGPIGFVGGIAAIAMGAAMAIQQKVFGSVPCILGGVAILKADSIVSSLGSIF